MVTTLKLVRRTFADRPDWVLVDEGIPIGTVYRMLELPQEGFVVKRLDTGETRELLAVLVERDGAEPGYMPLEVFEFVGGLH